MAEHFTNNVPTAPTGTLSAGITNVATSLTLNAGQGAGFPSTGTFRVLIDSEIITVGARSTDTLSSLTRASEKYGSTQVAASHSIGATVTHILTAGGILQAVTDQGVGSLPPGVIMGFAGASAPSGWVLCDGTSYTTAGQPNLFAIIGYAYGGSGANFNVPDLRGRIPGGKKTGTFATLGSTGGEQTHVITTSEMLSHNHSIAFNALDHSHTASFAGDVLAPHLHTYNVAAVTAGGHTIPDNFNKTPFSNNTSSVSGGTPTGTITVSAVSAGTPAGTFSSIGSGGSHNNIMPYQVINHVIKT